MNENASSDEIVAAAQRLGRPEFTRDDVAEELGVRRAQMRDAFRAARQAGRFQRARSDPDGTRYFRLADADAGDEE